MKRFITVLCTLTLVLFGAVQMSHAGLEISAPNTEFSSGGSGSFDVTIFNNNAVGGASYDLAAETLDLTLTGPAGVTFTGVDISTVSPYVYVLSGTVAIPTPLSFDAFSNTSFTTFDSEFASPFYREIDPGQRYGLAHIAYTVDPAGGSGNIQLIFGRGTSLSDINGSPIPYTIPEPSSWLLLATGLVFVMVTGYYRKQSELIEMLVRAEIEFDERYLE